MRAAGIRIPAMIACDKQTERIVKEYMDAWSFEAWGVRYWAMTPAFQKALAEHQQQENQTLYYLRFKKLSDFGWIFRSG